MALTRLPLLPWQEIERRLDNLVINQFFQVELNDALAEARQKLAEHDCELGTDCPNHQILKYNAKMAEMALLACREVVEEEAASLGMLEN